MNNKEKELVSTGRDAGPDRTNAPAPAFSNGGLVAQAESLFETYLAARLVRARRNVTNAKVTLLRDPRSRPKLDLLRRAEDEAEKLQAQLLEQARRLAYVRNGNVAPDAAPAEPSEQATPGFRTIQAARAAEILQNTDPMQRQSRPDDRHCPRCAATVSGEASVCGCGYQFVPLRLDVSAEPFLTQEELAALRGKSR